MALANDDRPYRVGKRSARGWDRVCEAWAKKKCATRERRLQVLADVQTELRGRLGDHDLFRYLAQDKCEPVRVRPESVFLLAGVNALNGLLERKKEQAAHTFPDPQWHPRWAGFEALGGGNLRNYTLQENGQRLSLSLPLLVLEGEVFEEEQVTIALAPSGQLQECHVERNGKKVNIGYVSARQTFSATLGGADILFSRRHMEHRDPEQLEHGDVGSVWLKMSLDVNYMAPESWLDTKGTPARPAAIAHFQTSLAKKSSHADEVKAGLRVLSVDLGLRTFAACAVFELTDRKPREGLFYPVEAETRLWARHERSFLLNLPGERAEQGIDAARRAATGEVSRLRREIYRLKELLRLAVKEDTADRKDALEQIQDDIRTAEDVGIGVGACEAEIAKLCQMVSKPEAIWQDAVREVYRIAETSLGQRIGQWRQRTRPRTAGEFDELERRQYRGGKSLWAVEYFDRIRKLLQGWSLRGREYGQINRLDRERRGVFGQRLLEHINSIKGDRIKAGSDLIVQAARGYLPQTKRGWLRQYEPCHVILFEDLARYRFRTDRPRHENSQLMRWSHREILSETALQAELYGCAVIDTGAGFTSRFHARSGAPGCRTRVLSAEDLQSPAIVTQLEFLADRLGVNVGRFQSGSRVPWPGGEQFTTLTKAGASLTLHADVNAAQNLQRRFWGRHADAYRISTVEVSQNGVSYWYQERVGPRLLGALAGLSDGTGYGRLGEAKDGDGSVFEGVTRQHWKHATGGMEDAATEEESPEEIELLLAEATDSGVWERGGGRKTFFRDPSGIVLRSDRWYESGEFWGRVQSRIARALGWNS